MPKINIKKYVLSLFFCFLMFQTTFATNYGLGYGANIKNGQVVVENAFEDTDDFQQILVGPNKTKMFIHYANGYSLCIPDSMEINTKLSRSKMSFSNSSNNLEVYYDSFYGSVNSFSSYVNYGNRFLQIPGHILDQKKDIKLGKYKAHVVKWHRNKLNRLEKDFNYYAMAQIQKNDKEVYTLILKSESPITGFEYILNTFQIRPKKQGTSRINTVFKPIKRTLNLDTKKFYDSYLSDNAKQRFGIFEYSTTTNLSALKYLESRVDYKFPVIVRYHTFDEKLPLRELQEAASDNKVVELTLQGFNAGKDNRTLTYDVLNGNYDSYLTEYAKTLKNFGKPVLFRFDNEMNGDWCPYSSFFTALDTKLYQDMWKHVYKIFEREGANQNVLWLWNPHDRSFPNFAWNDYLNYYPGDEYVDVVGLTGYNTGNFYPGEVWRSFDQVYGPIYNDYSSIFLKPMMITEFGSSVYGGDKNTWVNQMFASMKNYPKIKIAVWWNGIDWDVNKKPARVYKFDNDQIIIDTFKKGLQSYK